MVEAKCEFRIKSGYCKRVSRYSLLSKGFTVRVNHGSSLVLRSYCRCHIGLHYSACEFPEYRTAIELGAVIRITTLYDKV